MAATLLTRDAFREGVFARDGHKCVFCGDPAADAHHIMERRLFTGADEKGGYFLDNGASVCASCHLLCEMTVYSPDDVRQRAGITRVVLPSSLYSDHDYDKWGNVVLPDGRRLKGELFADESVQKILSRGGVLDRFTHWVKYPRTHHLPWSEGLHSDDRLMETLDGLRDERVVVTEKMDGENTTLYRDYIHARSLDGRNHPTRSWVKNLWGQICGDIPEGWRVCVENLYAKHSIGYEALPSYVMGFSVWNEANICLGWDETKEWFELLGIVPVPVLYDGPFNEAAIRALYDSREDWDRSEGYVVRAASAFPYGDFRRKVGKFVRRGHVQTTKHWMHGARIEPNGLAEKT